MGAPVIELSAEQAIDLAGRGTPLYVFDGGVARARARTLSEALEGTAAVRFAAKANRTPSVLKALRPAVDGLDVTSLGELEGALEAGFSGAEIGVSGPAKDAALLGRAADVGATVAVGSVAEGERLAAIASGAQVLVRINPKERIHAFRTNTGGGPTPFGIPEEEAPQAIARLLAAGLRPIGVHVHRGSQCTSVSALDRHVVAVLDLADRLAAYLDLRAVNLGGGLGVARGDMPELKAQSFGRRTARLLRIFRRAHPKTEFIVEPGRWIAAPAGLLLLRVVDRRDVRGTRFVVVDGGMDAFLFAVDAFRAGPPFPMRNLTRPFASAELVTLVGPACTPMDRICTIQLPGPEEGDLLAIEQAGAYAAGASMAGFLGRAAPPTVVL
jgi:diaminopimelate decarboxylase